MTISAILTILTTHILTSLIYYDVKVINRKNQKILQLPLEKRFAVSFKYICILIAVISVIRNAYAVTLLLLEKTAISSNINMLQIYSLEMTCKILSRLADIFVTYGTAFVYLFLWLRQRVLYTHPSLNVLNNRMVKITSWGIILIWFLYCFSTFLSYVILVQYQFDLDRGFLIADDTIWTFAYIVISWTIVSVLMQMALLGLFIYPIIKRTLWRSKDANQH